LRQVADKCRSADGCIDSQQSAWHNPDCALIAAVAAMTPIVRDRSGLAPAYVAESLPTEQEGRLIGLL